jgi:S1-C subfamily serine protease
MGSVGLNCTRLALAVTAVLLATALPARMPLAALDLDKLLAPVIALEARIPDDARSAATLGTVRGGTGVIIDGLGLVLTVGYLVLEADSVDLLPNGLAGERVPADVVAWDQITGLGLLRARRPLGIAPMTLGVSATLDAGDAVIAVGWQRIDAMLPAVVTERGVYAGYWEYMIEDALYVSPSHPAFPGAALVSLDGKLAGIGAFAHADPVDEYVLAGTVYIPVDTLKPVLGDLLLAGRSTQVRPWLGLYCEEVDGSLRVRRLPEDGPALRSGIRPGDYLVTVGSTPVTTLADFYRHLWATTRPGDRVSVGIRRGTRSFTVDVEAMDRYEHYRPPRPLP